MRFPTAAAWQFANFTPRLRSLRRRSPFSARSSGHSRPMCTLRRIADIASQAAQRRPAASSAPVPLSETELRDLQTLAASLTTSDLGLSRKDFTHPEITFISVAESPDYSIAIFVLPAGASLPLHDHVNMHVVTRVLWGSLEIREYDPLPDTFHSFKGFGPGCVAMRRPPVRAPTGAVRALTPTSGNVHSFHAHECTAVFDILVPPYDEHIGCRYYHAVELDNGDNSGILEASGEQVFLREIPCPDSYHTRSASYTGIPLSP